MQENLLRRPAQPDRLRARNSGAPHRRPSMAAEEHLMGDVASSLKEGFFMFWETLWALVLGFTLSGMVQAFVSRDQMRRALGDRRPAEVGRASVFGMVSSSCSYAASAMSKSLFQKGADFLTSLVFMFASTNLGLELGVVLWVLMGWQFAAAEFIGGAIMITLLVAVGRRVLKGRLIEDARAHLVADSHAHDHHDHEHTHEFERVAWREKLTS